jgi:hypothetical protein
MLLYSLFLKGPIWKGVWKNVAFKALVLTCADSYQGETVESLETDEINDHSYQEYITVHTESNLLVMDWIVEADDILRGSGRANCFVYE